MLGGAKAPKEGESAPPNPDHKLTLTLALRRMRAALLVIPPRLTPNAIPNADPHPNAKPNSEEGESGLANPTLNPDSDPIPDANPGRERPR